MSLCLTCSTSNQSNAKFCAKLGGVGDSKAYTKAKQSEWGLPWKALAKVTDISSLIPGTAYLGWLISGGVLGEAPSIFNQDDDVRDGYRMTSTILKRLMDCNK